MLQNKSLIITAVAAAIAYFLYSRLKPEDKQEVRNYIQNKTTGLAKQTLHESSNV
jgi:hypothetical protein